MTHVEKQPRIICPGWAGAHTEERVLSEGSEPASHGMCVDCVRAFGLLEQPAPTAGDAAVEALRRFPPPIPPPAGDWPFTSLEWQNKVVAWWNEIARPIVDGERMPAVTTDVDLASEPDRAAFLCGSCGHTSETAEGILAHECASRIAPRRPNPHWRADGGP
ncbi:hypothetical protein LCGC14_1317630 [marine sediment metagenome]|uniref:Uncharacterized protein n=1 Tax=marine sediment metagenome TaxID=412755 RepID=A0A0F9KKH2_9ZZZZ